MPDEPQNQVSESSSAESYGRTQENSITVSPQSPSHTQDLRPNNLEPQPEAGQPMAEVSEPNQAPEPETAQMGRIEPMGGSSTPVDGPLSEVKPEPKSHLGSLLIANAIILCSST